MPSAPDIVTPRLLLREPTEADRAVWIRLHRDPRTYAHAPHAMAPTDEAAGEQFDKVVRHWREHGFGYHLVEQDGSVVGCGGLKVNPATEDHVTELNLYYRLAFESHGQGLAREAARAWVAWGIEWLPAQPVVAAVSEGNPRSIATARSSGLEESGRRLLPGDPPEFGAAVILTAPSVEVVRGEAFDAPTREAVLNLWCATNDAGGAVGFLPGAPRERVAEALAAHERGMTAGDVTAVLLRSAADRAVVGLGFWQRPTNPLLHHRRTAYRVMTDPGRRGRNLGRLLMGAMHRVARADGAELGELGVRGGYGTEDFYAALGWRELARLPGGIRVAPGDDRDDISMWRRFD